MMKTVREKTRVRNNDRAPPNLLSQLYPILGSGLFTNKITSKWSKNISKTVEFARLPPEIVSRLLRPVRGIPLSNDEIVIENTIQMTLIKLSSVFLRFWNYPQILPPKMFAALRATIFSTNQSILMSFVTCARRRRKILLFFELVCDFLTFWERILMKIYPQILVTTLARIWFTHKFSKICW